MGGVHNNQALGHLGIANGKVPGQYTAPVMPNNDGLLMSQSFNQSFNVAQEIRYFVALAWFICVVIAAQVRGNNGISMLGQKRNLVSPRIPELREAMQEQNQWSLTLGYIVHPNAIGNDISMLPWFCCGCCHKFYSTLVSLKMMARLTCSIRSVTGIPRGQASEQLTIVRQRHTPSR